MYDMVGWLAGGLAEQQGQIHSFITSTDGKERPCTCLTYHNSDSACYNVTKRMSVSGCLQVNNPCLHLYPCSTQISRFKHFLPASPVADEDETDLVQLTISQPMGFSRGVFRTEGNVRKLLII